MQIKYFPEIPDNPLEPSFEVAIFPNLVPRLNGRRLAFDVGEDGGDFRHFATNFRFQGGYAVMRLQQAELFVQFQVLLHVQLTTQVLHAHVVDVQVVAHGHRADAVEYVFPTVRLGNGVDHHVCLGQHAMHRRFYRVRHLLRALKGEIPSYADGNVSKVVVSRAANAHSVQCQHSFQLGNFVDDAGADPGGGRIQQGVNSLARQP